MKDLLIEVKGKDGELKQGMVIMPDNLEEAVMLLGHDEVYSMFKTYYLIRAKSRVKLGSTERRKYLKIELKSLNPDQRAALEALGLLKS